MQKINVLYVIPSLNIGGSEKKVMTFLKYLNRDVFTPFLMLITEKGSLFEEAKKLDIEMVVVNKKHRFDLSVVSRMEKYMRLKNIDIVHVFTSTGKLWGRLAAKKARVKVIISTEESLFRNTFIDRLLERYFASKTDAIIANSHQTMLSQINSTHLKPSLFHVIHNGIDYSLFLNEIKKEEKLGVTRILCVARLDFRKGLFYLVDAIKLLVDLGYPVQLSIAGDGPLRVSINQRIEELHLQEHIHMLGFVHDIPKLMKTHDLFVLPSLEEGFGNVILEAMSSNLYVIATKVGGIPEIIQNEDLGTLIEPKSSDDIRDAIIFAIEHKELIQKRISHALIHSKKFSYEYMIQSHEELYQKLYHKKVKS